MYCKECGAKVPEGAKYCMSCGASMEIQPTSTNVLVEGPPTPWDSSTQGSGTQYDGNASAPQQPSPRKRARPGGLTIALAFLCLALCFMLQVFAYLIIEGLRLPIQADTALVIVSAIGASVSIVLLGGRRLLLPKRDALLLALKKGWWVLLTSVGLMVLEMMSTVVEGEVLVEDGWPLRLLAVFVLCLGIGLSEEASFRGLIFGSFLDALGKNKRGIYIAAILSSALFGMAHIDWVGLNYTDPLSLAQAFLKTIQTGFYGFFLAALLLRSKNVIGGSLLHGLSDFFLLFPSAVLLNGTVSTDYVASGEEAIATIILYLVFIALYTPLVVIGKKMLNEVPPPDRGPLHKE